MLLDALLVVENGDERLTFGLYHDMPPVRIGRDQDCEIVIARSGVSRIHATVHSTNGRFSFRSVGKNGTRYRGMKLYRPIDLDAGVSLDIGGACLSVRALPSRSRPDPRRSGTLPLPPEQVDIETEAMRDRGGVEARLLEANAQLEARIAELDAEREQAATELAELRDTLGQSRAKLDEARAQVTRVMAINDELTSERDRLRSERDLLRHHPEVARARLRADVEDARRGQSTLSTDLYEKRLELRRLKASLKDRDARVEDLQTRLAIAEYDLNEARSEIEKLGFKIEHDRELIERLRASTGPTTRRATAGEDQPPAADGRRVSVSLRDLEMDPPESVP